MDGSVAMQRNRNGGKGRQAVRLKSSEENRRFQAFSSVCWTGGFRFDSENRACSDVLFEEKGRLAHLNNFLFSAHYVSSRCGWVIVYASCELFHENRSWVFAFLQMNKLIEYYQQLAQKEKVERDRKKLARRRNYMPLAFSVRTWCKRSLPLIDRDQCGEGTVSVSENGCCPRTPGWRPAGKGPGDGVWVREWGLCRVSGSVWGTWVQGHWYLPFRHSPSLLTVPQEAPV